jgi:hypothetical protein
MIPALRDAPATFTSAAGSPVAEPVCCRSVFRHNDMMLVKFDTNGNHLWSKASGTPR